MLALWIRIAKPLIAASLMAAILACSDGVMTTEPSQVEATVEPFQDGIVKGSSRDMRLTFRARHGYGVRNLRLDADSLPAGWQADTDTRCDALLPASWNAATADYYYPDQDHPQVCTLGLIWTPPDVGATQVALRYTYQQLDSGAPGSGEVLVTVQGIADVTTTRWIYQAQDGNGAILRCAVATSGLLTDCMTAATGHGNLTAMTRIGRSLYAASSGIDTGGNPTGSPAVIHCRILDDGSLDGCARTAENIPIPLGLAGRDNWIKVASIADATLYHCTVDAVGRPASCVAELTLDNAIQGLTLSGNHLYVGRYQDDASGVLVCDVATDGAASNCRPAGSSGGAALNVLIHGGQAWLAHYNDNQLSRCSVLATGEFDRCENAIYPATASGPYGMSATDTHLFISQVQGNALSRCALDPAGNLSDCSDVLTDLAQPSGITMITLP